jgi:RNA polymerase sigma factor (sigma-70 family)
VSQQLKDKLTDKQLVDLVLAGDMHAFRCLVETTRGLVAQIVNRLIQTPEDRKDVAQDVYLKTFHNLAGFRFQSKLSTWIGQIAYNTCINRLQKKQLTIYGPPESPADDQTDRPLIQKELKGLLETEIGRLPPIYQTLIGLYHHEELSYLEIAGITGLPEGTVKSYLFRARKQLKDSMLSLYKNEKL